MDHSYSIVTGHIGGIFGYWDGRIGTIQDATYNLPGGSSARIRQTMVVGGKLRFVINNAALGRDDGDQFPERITVISGTDTSHWENPTPATVVGQGVSRDYALTSGADPFTASGRTLTVHIFNPVVDPVDPVVDPVDPVTLDEQIEKLHLEIVPLIDISVLDGTTVRHLYVSNRFVTADGNDYLDLLTEKNGISDIARDLPILGGISTVSSATIRLVNATSDPDVPLSKILSNYKIIGQAVRIKLALLPATDRVLLWTGVVSKISMQDTITLSLVNTSRNDILDVPTRIASLSEYPNISLSDVGRPIPIVFGNLNSVTDRILAPAIETDFFLQRYIAAARAKTYGSVYYLKDDAFGVWPITSDGEYFTIEPTPAADTGTGSATISENVAVHNIDVDRRYYVPDQRAVVSISRVTVDVSFSTLYGRRSSHATAPDITIGLYYGRRLLQSRSSRNTAPGHQFGAAIAIHEWNESTVQISWNGNITGEEESLNVRIRADIRGNNRSIISWSSIIVQYVYTGPAPGDLPGSVALYQAIEGYKDSAANYTDGPPVNAEGASLSHPADIIHAILRDQEYFMGQPSARVNRDNIADVRAATGASYRFDFVTRDTIGFLDFNDMIEQGQMYLRTDSEGRWDLRTLKSDALKAVFTHGWNIEAGSFSTETSPLRDVKNRFFLRYGYSHTRQSYNKTLIRSGRRSAHGTGNLSNDGTFTVTAIVTELPVAVGHRMLYDTRYYIIDEIVSNMKWMVTREGSEGIVGGQGEDFEVGLNFDAICHDSEVAYGQRPFRGTETSAIESPYIHDDATARSYLDHLIIALTSPRQIVQFIADIGAARLKEGDLIAVDHPYLPGPDHIGALTANLAADTTDVSWALRNGVIIERGDYVIVQSADRIYFEVLQENRYPDVRRAQLNSVERHWGSTAKIYRPSCTYRIEHITISLTRGKVSIRASTAPNPT